MIISSHVLTFFLGFFFPLENQPLFSFFFSFVRGVLAMSFVISAISRERVSGVAAESSEVADATLSSSCFFFFPKSFLTPLTFPHLLLLPVDVGVDVEITLPSSCPCPCPCSWNSATARSNSEGSSFSFFFFFELLPNQLFF
jgi:hypothetical protein